MLKTEVAQLLRSRIGKDNPTVNQVHVPTAGANTAPKGKGKTRLQRLRERRGELAKAIAKAMGDTETKEGTYVGRLVLNANELATWWAAERTADEPAQLDACAHITVAYSRVEFPWTDDPSAICVPPECFAGFKVLGKDNAVVLCLKVPVLESRWKDTLTAGATWDHDGYQPHITLFYLGADVSGASVREDLGLPSFPILLGPELSGPRGADVFTPAAPDWYVAPA